ncbi:MAG: hypothetical protein QOG59_3657, partial [Solirubrobacteraceae bacterium]|nr:hypothetical protein [Solirubrobacteraceae bacterium]
SNFAPVALICRVTSNGPLSHWVLQRVVAYGGVLLLGAWVLDALRGQRATAWDVFSFTCALSVMLSSVMWTHYQIVLAPLFLLLLVRFSAEGTGIGPAAGLLAAYGLASLIWAPLRGSPYGSTIAALHAALGRPVAAHEPVTVEALAQFAQYLLVVTGVIWYSRRRETQTRPP